MTSPKDDAEAREIGGEFGRAFAMPCADTLSMLPIKSWAKYHLRGRSQIVDPFARNSRLAHWRNDLSPDTAAEHHMDAVEFIAWLADQGVQADGFIFDPPYSPRQISEVYQKIGRACGTAETQNASLYRRVREAAEAILLPGAIVLSFGWNSAGMGKNGFARIATLLVHHGGAHNDTICVADRRALLSQRQVA